MEMWRTFLPPDNRPFEANISASSDKCPPYYQMYSTMLAVTQLVSAAVCFPASTAVLGGIFHRHWQSPQRSHSRSSSLAASPDLIIINLMFFEVINSIEQVLSVINSLQGDSHLLVRVIIGMRTFVLSVGPVGMVCTCLDCYLAVVHPLRYTALRTTWKHPLLFTMLIWFYGITIIIIIVCQLPLYNHIGIVIFYIALPVIIFLNVSTLKALCLAGPRRHRLADLCPTKRRAFWVVLSILLASVIYCIPQIIMLTYRALIKVGQVYFQCVVCPIVMMLPTIISAVFSLLFASTMFKYL